MAFTFTTATSQPFANWTDGQESAFIDVCVEFIAERDTSVSGFYATVATTMNNRFNLEFTENQIKNKWDNMKRAFRDLDMLLRTPGGVWNAEFNYLDGPDDFWSTGGGKSFRKFRKHSPMKFREQDIMFEGCLRKDTCAYPIPPVAIPTAPAPPPASVPTSSFFPSGQPSRRRQAARASSFMTDDTRQLAARCLELLQRSGLQDLGEGGNLQGAREAVEEQVMDNESQDLNLAGDLALAPTSSGECSATSGKGKRAMDHGVVMLRRSARGMGHPLAGKEEIKFVDTIGARVMDRARGSRA